jgi:cardiolipin synthase
MNSAYDVYASSKEAWDAMYQTIQTAKKSVYWEMYIFADDEAGKGFFDLLEKKALEGVDVKLIVDSWGTFWFPKKRIVSLKAAGVELVFFQERKRRYRGLWLKLISRTHRKILVVDEKIGFIGGVNVQKGMESWLDMHVKIEGKVVRSLLRSFAKMYVICGGSKEKVKHLLKYPFRVFKDKVEFVYDDAHARDSMARQKYIEALTRARERVILFSPYYIPDKEFLKALWNARKRGVRVDLLIPFRTDLRIVTYAAYFFFELMQKFGVKIFLVKQMMHGKGVVVDDDWAMIGSSNLEHTSFYDSYEANVKIKDRVFVKRVKDTLQEWMDAAKELNREEWGNRGSFHKIQEWIAYKLYGLWHRRANAKLYEDYSKSQTITGSDETPKS